MLQAGHSERVLGRRFQLVKKRENARGYEVLLYAAAAFIAATLPIGLLIHGSDGVTGAWNVPLASAQLILLAQWPGYYRRRAHRQLREWDSTLDKIASRFESGGSPAH